MRTPLVAALALLSSTVLASPLTPGNILVTKGGFREIFEYTRFGKLVQSFKVPKMLGQTSSDYIRDVVVDSRGNIHVFNGTFIAGISSLNVAEGTWTNRRFFGFSVANNGTYGKLETIGDYVFATDGWTYGGEKTGIIRYNTVDGTWTRFARQQSNEEAIDITIGRDGLLYALNGAGSPSGRFVEAYDPLTLELKRKFDLPRDFVWGDGMSSRTIWVNRHGEIYLNQLYGPVYKLSRDLQVLGSYAYTQTSYVDDMDVSQEGRVLITQFDGRVVILNNLFEEVRSFETTGYYYSQSFGAWIPTPPPATEVP